MADHPIECRVGAKITLEQCHKRQLTMRRWDMGGKIDAHFISCKSCEHWIPDEEYLALKKMKGRNPASWTWAGAAMTTEKLRNNGRKGKCRKI